MSRGSLLLVVLLGAGCGGVPGRVDGKDRARRSGPARAPRGDLSRRGDTTRTRARSPRRQSE